MLNSIVNMRLVMIKPDGVSSSVVMTLLLVSRIKLSVDVIVVLRLKEEAILVLPDSHDIALRHLNERSDRASSSACIKERIASQLTSTNNL